MGSKFGCWEWLVGEAGRERASVQGVEIAAVGAVGGRIVEAGRHGGCLQHARYGHGHGEVGFEGQHDLEFLTEWKQCQKSDWYTEMRKIRSLKWKKTE